MLSWFSNRNTATKLVGGFSLVLAILAFTGVFALQRLGRVQGAAVEISDNWLPSVQALGDIHAGVMNYRAKEMRHILLTDRDEMARLGRVLDSVRTAVNAQAAAYQKLITSPEERVAWDRTAAAWSRYQELSARTIAASEAGRNEEAKRLAMGDGLAAVNATGAALGEGVDINRRGAQAARDGSAATYASARVWIVGVLLAGIALGLTIAVALSRMIARPLVEGVRVLEQVAAGDLTVRLDLHTEDEIGQLARSLNQALDALQRALKDVRDSSTSTASASQQLTAAALEISSGAQEQASSLEETAASLEEMTATVKQNADNAQQAQQLAAGAREVADRGGRVVGDAVGAMREINASSKKIADIITTIDEIAFQTNLLALNAAVEAARAGAQGRGFAVVAGEVRSLAQRSATAAKEIKGLIQDSVRKVEHGTSMVTASGETLQDIVSSVKRVADIVAEIAAASKEQATGIDQVNKAVTQMDAVTQANAGQTEELSGTAESMAQQAQELQQLVSRFTLEQGGRPETSAPRSPRVPPVRTTSRRAPVARPVPAAAPHAAPVPAGVAAGDELPGLDGGFEEY